MWAAAPRPAGPLSALALLAIRGYQRWLSPLKRFRCAHSVLHGGPGCSGYAMQEIRASGLICAVDPMRRRFRDCRAALGVLKSEQSAGEEGDDEKAEIQKNGYSWCDVIGVLGCALCGGSQS